MKEKGQASEVRPDRAEAEEVGSTAEMSRALEGALVDHLVRTFALRGLGGGGRGAGTATELERGFRKDE